MPLTVAIQASPILEAKGETMRSRLLVTLVGGLLLSACGTLSARQATRTTTPTQTTTVTTTTVMATTTSTKPAPEEISSDVDLTDVDAALADLDQLIGELDASLTKDEGDVTQ
jgi:uncharacterized lipoprotein YajG